MYKKYIPIADFNANNPRDFQQAAQIIDSRVDPRNTGNIVNKDRKSCPGQFLIIFLYQLPGCSWRNACYSMSAEIRRLFCQADSSSLVRLANMNDRGFSGLNNCRD